jgi:hypothetical protein
LTELSVVVIVLVCGSECLEFEFPGFLHDSNNQRNYLIPASEIFWIHKMVMNRLYHARECVTSTSWKQQGTTQNHYP